jgi:hypothetical protein
VASSSSSSSLNRGIGRKNSGLATGIVVSSRLVLKV